ncbi:MAG: CPBP family intramembrane glutamic endopeptidase [Candidatus Acidiferrales bacterium]
MNFEADPPEAALSPVPTPELEPQPASRPYARKAPPSPFETVFLDDDGILPGWGLLIFIAILAAISAVFFLATHNLAVARTAAAEARSGLLSSGTLLLQEVPQFVTVLLAAWAMTFIEKRSLGRYGLPQQGAFGSRFWQGAAWGFLQLTLLLVAMHLLGGYSFGTLSLHGPEILKYAALDAVGFLFVGLSEEFLLRGYLQFTLGRGLGFWPAAIITSLLFASAHLGNPGEAGLGIFMVAVDGMFCCLVLWRTGNLWWAIGNHAAWDFSQSYLYGVPDSGLMATKHLMNPSFHGPNWLTGGSVGPEGSVLIPVLFLVTIVVFHFCYPQREYVLPERG